MTTFEFTVLNETADELTLTTIEFIPSRIKRWFENGSDVEFVRTLVSIEEMNHEGHIVIPFDKVVVDDPINTETEIVIPARKSSTFTIWFRSHNGDRFSIPTDASGVLKLTGNAVSIKTPLTLQIRPDELRPYDPFPAPAPS